YVANDSEPNHLWINQGDGTFVDLALVLGAAVTALGQAEAGMGIAIGDVDDDSDLDLFVTHLRGESNTFYRYEGESGFRDDTGPALLSGPSLPFTGFGTGFFDYDHDGDLDLAVVNGRVTRGPLMTGAELPGYWDPYGEPDLLFTNDGRGRFLQLSGSATSLSGHIENGRGLLFGDLDDDGDIDLLVTNEGGSARLLLNAVEKEGHWLMIRALDPELQRDAVGARITVVAGDERFHRLVTPGYSFLSSNDMRAHFGLGAAESVDEIVVQWPDGATETFPGVRADQVITLRKGQSGR
ncbi:MAG: ASPIC/UnbV domain-containing protein, partial [Myxococcota bacterium]